MPSCTERNNELYVCNHVPKQWEGEEIFYITQHLEKLEKLNKYIIVFTFPSLAPGSLNAHFNKDIVLGEERKRITRRRKEQRRKACHRQKLTNLY